ncbi:MAG TPA: histidinol dehydrogenase [Candidatus Hydrogenedentes bacterium]|nr:histidinol dehydrogenase [Candidatus Hydrogenedentota bacterium]
MKVFEIHNSDDINKVRAFLEKCASRIAADGEDESREAAVRAIIHAVRDQGDAAVSEYTKRFDGVDLSASQFELTPKDIDAAINQVPKHVIAMLERAQENIRAFHARNLRESWEESAADGSMYGQRITPIESAGVYVPGGKAFYPSSVLMNIVPARVAGVKEISMVSPPSYNGSVHPAVVAAAKLAGATRIFRVGGAQAIAALAFGTDTIPAVVKITGPGNAYVTKAKALVRGAVDIDSEAGPSEVAVIADAKANPHHVAAELLAQAEHDEDAMCLLFTPSKELAKATLKRVRERAAKMVRAEIITKSLERFGAVIIVPDMDAAIALVNFVAPEHLSVQTEYAQRIADKIINAGAIMLGAMTPVAVGDYYAGPNHILPTMRRARYSSPLSAEDFRKVTNVMFYSRERLLRDAHDIEEMASLEGLEAHAESVTVRIKDVR